MNTKALRKSYDTLTPPERYAAISAAIGRNDEAERRALIDSAPRKSFSVPNTWGIVEAWETLAGWHVVGQMSDAAAFFMALHMNDEAANATEGEAFEMLTRLQARMLARAQAWRELCDEYKIDPAPMLEPYPGYAMLDVIELVMTAANGGEPADRAAIDAELAGMREVIAHYRKEWE